MRHSLLIVIAFGACETKPAEKTASAPSPMQVKRTATRPTLPPTRPTMVVAWSLAEASNTADAWDAAAEAYEDELGRCEVDCSESAYAMVLARKNAFLAEPMDPPAGEDAVPLPPRARAVVDALDHYVTQAEAGDPDVPGMKFLAGQMLNRWRQPDGLVRLAALLRAHRGDPTSEYAANILLDALVRADRIDEVRVLVEELLADSAFLVGKDELRETLLRLRTIIAQAANP